MRKYDNIFKTYNNYKTIPFDRIQRFQEMGLTPKWTQLSLEQSPKINASKYRPFIRKYKNISKDVYNFQVRLEDFFSVFIIWALGVSLATSLVCLEVGHYVYLNL